MDIKTILRDIIREELANVMQGNNMQEQDAPAAKPSEPLTPTKRPAPKSDRESANERHANKLLRQLRWHEDRLALKRKAIAEGWDDARCVAEGLRRGRPTAKSIAWSQGHVDDLRVQLTNARGRAARDASERMPEAAQAAKVAQDMAQAAGRRPVHGTRESILAARKGDRVLVRGVTYHATGAGWLRNVDTGEAIRKSMLADMADNA
jgi:hypothetical protein